MALLTPEEVDRIEQRAKAALTYEKSEYDPAEGVYTSPAESPNTEEDLTCPLCDGDGYIEGQRYDSKETYASTVVAYGIGEGLGRAEEWVENGPADVLRLVEAVRVLRNENIVIFGAFEVTDKNAKAFETETAKERDILAQQNIELNDACVRYEKALKDARYSLSILASHLDHPEVEWPNYGLKSLAMSYKKRIEEIDAVLKGEP